MRWWESRRIDEEPGIREMSVFSRGVYHQRCWVPGRDIILEIRKGGSLTIGEGKPDLVPTNSKHIAVRPIYTL